MRLGLALWFFASSLWCLAATSAPPITGGNEAVRASLRLIPTLAQGAGLTTLAPAFFAKLAADQNSGLIYSSSSSTTSSNYALTLIPSSVKPMPNGNINPIGRPSQVGTATNQVFQLDANRSENPAGQPATSFGPPGSTPLVGAWSGSGASQVGAYLNGTFFLDSNGDGVFTSGIDSQISLGVSGVSIVGDWNGDGKTKVGIYNSSTGIFTLDYNGTGTSPLTYNNFAPGTGRTPVIGDWNGDGKSKIGWNVNGFWAVDYNGNGIWDGETIDRFAGFGGNSGETPMVGDWSGSGTSKIGVYYQGFWGEDINGNFLWDGTPTDGFGGFGGNAGELPVIGDWNGDGRTKVGFYLSGSFILDYNGNLLWDGPPTDRNFLWAQNTSRPVIGRWQTAAAVTCTDNTTMTYDYSAVTRLNGNFARGFAQTSTYGNYASYWKPYLSTAWSLNNVGLCSM